MNWRMALLLAGVGGVSLGSSLAESMSLWWLILDFAGGLSAGIAASPAVKL